MNCDAVVLTGWDISPDLVKLDRQCNWALPPHILIIDGDADPIFYNGQK